MYTLKILTSEIITVLDSGLKQLSVQYQISKDDQVLITRRQGFAVDISKEQLLAELTQAKDQYALENEQAEIGPAEGAQVAAEITALNDTEL